MAIGKVQNIRSEGTGDTIRYVAHIVLLPSFPIAKYSELKPRVPGQLMAGTTLWSESGHELEVIDSGTAPSGSGLSNIKLEYPYIVAKTKDSGTRKVFGKVTNDDKEALTWLKKIGHSLLPTTIAGIPVWTSLYTWNNKWKPLLDRLDSSDNASNAYKVVQEIRESDKLPTLAGEAISSASSPIDSAKMTAGAAKNEGKQALRDAATVVKNEASDWWGSIGMGWKFGIAAVGIVAAGMIISEKVD